MASFNNYDQQAEAGAAPDFELLPRGEYVGKVIESDVKANSKGTGTVLALTYELLSQGYVGRRIWQNINVVNASEKAQEIGQRELANIKAAIGVTGQVRDTLQLHEKPLAIKLDVELGGGQYKDKNVVKDVRSVEAMRAAANAPASAPASAPAQPATQAQESAPASAPAPAAGGTPPWMRRAA